MEAVSSSANLNQAYKRAKANAGAQGVDGMSVEALRARIALNRSWDPHVEISGVEGVYRLLPLGKL
jgi:RNA-directed DNA polymerase